MMMSSETENPDLVQAAIFYSITSTQRGLQVNKLRFSTGFILQEQELFIYISNKFYILVFFSILWIPRAYFK
jgi:hypothetical protein